MYISIFDSPATASFIALDLLASLQCVAPMWLMLLSARYNKFPDMYTDRMYVCMYRLWWLYNRNSCTI